MAKTGLGFHPQPGFFIDQSCPFSDQSPCPKEQPLRQRFQLPFGQIPLFEGEGDFQDAPVLRRKEGEKVPLPAQVLAGHPQSAWPGGQRPLICTAPSGWKDPVHGACCGRTCGRCCRRRCTQPGPHLRGRCGGEVHLGSPRPGWCRGRTGRGRRVPSPAAPLCRRETRRPLPGGGGRLKGTGSP